MSKYGHAILVSQGERADILGGGGRGGGGVERVSGRNAEVGVCLFCLLVA